MYGALRKRNGGKTEEWRYDIMKGSVVDSKRRDEQKHKPPSLEYKKRESLTRISHWNAGPTFKVYCKLSSLLPQCCRNLTFRLFHVQPATSQINLNTIRLTAAQNKNENIMTHSGLKTASGTV